MDYYSRYFEVAQIHNTKATTVINQMKSMFPRHGIPMKVMSDQGPQYSSSEFEDFAKMWGFEHQTSSPYYPRSNGLAERTVQTVKNILKKSKASQLDPLLAFLEYRNTPIDNIGSPAELLMSRKLRSVLPPTRQSLRLKVKKHKMVKSALLSKQERQKYYYDRQTKQLKPVHSGEKVRILQQNKWEPAIVTEKLTSPRSYEVETPSGGVYRRNRSHILKSGEEVTQSKDSVNTDTTASLSKNNTVDIPYATEKTASTSVDKPYIIRYGREIQPVQRYQ